MRAIHLLTQHLNQIAEFVISKSRQELRDQGHYASGKLDVSFEFKVEDVSNRLSLKVSAEDYARALDIGVRSSRIGYSIEHLRDWAKIVHPELNEQEITKFLWAVRSKHKKEGIPTRGAYKWTKNGRRTKWIEFGINRNEKGIEEMLDLFSVVTALVDDVVDEAKRAARKSVN